MRNESSGRFWDARKFRVRGKKWTVAFDSPPVNPRRSNVIFCSPKGIWLTSVFEKFPTAIFKTTRGRSVTLLEGSKNRLRDGGKTPSVAFLAPLFPTLFFPKHITTSIRLLSLRVFHSKPFGCMPRFRHAVRAPQFPIGAAAKRQISNRLEEVSDGKPRLPRDP